LPRDLLAASTLVVNCEARALLGEHGGASAEQTAAPCSNWASVRRSRSAVRSPPICRVASTGICNSPSTPPRPATRLSARSPRVFLRGDELEIPAYRLPGLAATAHGAIARCHADVERLFAATAGS
jgi:hypothetical protein